ncbi:MAG: hypothetical protein ACRC1U_05055, partial [Vibrionaceae bacterium]
KSQPLNELTPTRTQQTKNALGVLLAPLQTQKQKVKKQKAVIITGKNSHFSVSMTSNHGTLTHNQTLTPRNAK